jgi:hypothetical protein
MGCVILWPEPMKNLLLGVTAAALLISLAFIVITAMKAL